MEESQNKLLIPMAILIASSLIAWGIFATKEKTPIADNSKQITSTITNTVEVKDSDYILGNPDADLIFITFSDFECGFCKIFHQTMHQIIDEYGKNGQVAWIFRQAPIYGVTAEEKAAAARCAGQLGSNTKFWEMSDKIFQTKFSKEKEFVVEQLTEIARSIKLDENKFVKCLNSKAILKEVQQEYQNGVNVGFLGTDTTQGGTPYTLILTRIGKTYPINGAQPYSVIKPIIDLIIKGQ